MDRTSNSEQDSANENLEMIEDNLSKEERPKRELKVPKRLSDFVFLAENSIPETFKEAI